jgi:glycosyltransferase involved in cell wall biosynthesis
MASGRGVVATPVGMAPALITDNYNGFLVPEADSAALADAISRALPEAERLGANAAETFQRIGDWNRVAEELESIYEAAVARRAGKTR